MIVDAHVHTLGHERPDAIRSAMDRAGIDRVCLLSPPKLASAEEQREALSWMRDLTAADPDRLLGYFWLNPVLDDAVALIEEAATTPGIRAFKLMSDHWYPHDDRLRPALAAIEQSTRPALFHAGILWSHMDSSRFCRPVDFEALLHYPALRFTLAHMAWPWVEECFALAARMRDGIKKITGGPNTMYVDISPGTPEPVREAALRIALLIGEKERLLWGSDDAEPESLEKAKRMLDLDRELLRRLEVDGATEARILGGNTLELLGIVS